MAVSVYVLVLQWSVKRFPAAKRILWTLALIGLLLSIGALRSRELLGPVFVKLDAAVFLTATPGLATFLTLRNREYSIWSVVATACAIFALSTLFVHIHISESLYGIDGVGGPYSTVPFEK